jgi:hypothetical protein
MNAPGDIEGMQDVPTAIETFGDWRDKVCEADRKTVSAHLAANCSAAYTCEANDSRWYRSPSDIDTMGQSIHRHAQ